VLKGMSFDRTRNPATDPAVLNSVIYNNGWAGIVLYDAPIYSIELNELYGNEGAPILFAFSQPTSGICSGFSNCPDGGRACGLQRGRCTLRANRIERNTIVAREKDGPLFDMVWQRSGTVTALTLTRPANAGFNYFDGLSADEVQTLSAASVALDQPLESADPQAGLVEELRWD